MELGRVPALKDFGPQFGTVGHHAISNRYPGGFRRALQVAAAELGLQVTYKCERCGKEFISLNGLAIHRHYCTTEEKL
jgi:hypothetical protein